MKPSLPLLLALVSGSLCAVGCGDGATQVSSELASEAALSAEAPIASWDFANVTATSDWATEVPSTMGGPAMLLYQPARAFEGAASLNGGFGLAYVEEPFAAIATSGAFTLSAWVYPSDLSGVQYVLSREETPPTDGIARHEFVMGLEQGRPVFGVHTSGFDEFLHKADASVPADTWTHLSLTYDGIDLTMYVAGRRVVVASVGWPLAAGSWAPLVVGDAVGTPSGWLDFRGRVDDIRIYDFALSPEQVRERAAQRK